MEIGDASAFKSSGHLAAYAGIAPVTRASGSSIKGEHPARTGNRKLKRAVFLAAFAALSDPTSRTYYDRKRGEGNKRNAALICLARRRCDVLFAMLRNQTSGEAELMTVNTTTGNIDQVHYDLANTEDLNACPDTFTRRLTQQT